jgi:hypothetical protein
VKELQHRHVSILFWVVSIHFPFLLWRNLFRDTLFHPLSPASTNWFQNEINRVPLVGHTLFPLQSIFNRQPSQCTLQYCAPQNSADNKSYHRGGHEKIQISNLMLNSSRFSDIMPCSPAKVNRRFGIIFRLNLQGRRLNQARNQQEASSNKMWCSPLFNTGWISSRQLALIQMKSYIDTKETL